MASHENVNELMDGVIEDLKALKVESHKAPPCHFAKHNIKELEEAFKLLHVDPDKPDDVAKEKIVKNEFLELATEVRFVIQDARNFTSGRRGFIEACDKITVLESFVKQHQSVEVFCSEALKTKQKRLNDYFSITLMISSRNIALSYQQSTMKSSDASRIATC